MRKFVLLLLLFSQNSLAGTNCDSAITYLQKILGKLEKAAVAFDPKLDASININVTCYEHDFQKESGFNSIHYGAVSILNANFEDEIASTLGHELSHILKKHSLIKCNDSYDCENEADELGMTLMSIAGYNPNYFGVELMRGFLTAVDKDGNDIDVSTILTFNDKVHLPLTSRLNHLSKYIANHHLKNTVLPIAIPQKVKQAIASEIKSDD